MQHRPVFTGTNGGDLMVLVRGPPRRGASRVRSLEWMAVTIDRRRVDGSGRERMGSGSMRLSEAGGGRSGAFGGVQGRAGRAA